MTQKESHIQSQWLGLLACYGVFHWRQSTTALTHTIGGKTFRRKNPLKGFPDTAGITKKGKFWAAEIKRPKEKLTPEQLEWKKDILESNGLYKVITTFEESLDFLQEILSN